MTGAQMLSEWLAEDRERHCGSIAYSPSVLWTCWIYDEDSQPYGCARPTPDAAMKTAVEAARKGSA